uniref:Uncharacterized protein n=1 Tax=viral metagenome TaxID=1070528 RepID=A0A6C0H229_9ZZZZ
MSYTVIIKTVFCIYNIMGFYFILVHLLANLDWV